MSQFFDLEACVILASWPEVEPILASLKDEVLTTGLPGSPEPSLFHLLVCCLSHQIWLLSSPHSFFVLDITLPFLMSGSCDGYLQPLPCNHVDLFLFFEMLDPIDSLCLLKFLPSFLCYMSFLLPTCGCPPRSYWSFLIFFLFLFGQAMWLSLTRGPAVDVRSPNPRTTRQVPILVLYSLHSRLHSLTSGLSIWLDMDLRALPFCYSGISSNSGVKTNFPCSKWLVV